MKLTKAVKTGLIVGILYAIIGIIGILIGAALLGFSLYGGVVIVALILIIVFIVGFVQGFTFWYITRFFSKLAGGKFPSVINGILFAVLALASGDPATIIIAFLTGLFSYKVANMKIT